MSEPYAIEPEPRGPNLPGQAVVRETEDQVLDVLAADIYVHALECVRQFGDFHFAITAGRFQERLCLRLMVDPAVRMLPWNRAHIWATHAEPRGGGRTTFDAIIDLLADHAGIPDRQIHVPGPGGAEHASAYELELQEHLAWREKGHDRLDLAVVSLESDGGWCGLGEPDPGEPGARLIAPTGAAGLTMTPTLIEATRLIAVGATGADLKPMLRAVSEGDAPVFSALPRPIGGSLRWYIDRAACPE
ncbi:MAG: 6-phosphogluconolactonase [Phycisphaeraceae bacterium]|nr:MAG: 6-phosphogluconolactonase [Phycisphaeraceae bacterium]